ncbi:MAG: DUF3568 family protein [Phycisphaerales bacterium JB039]
MPRLLLSALLAALTLPLAGCFGGAELAVASAGISAARTGGAIWEDRELVVATTIPIETLQTSVRQAFYALKLEMRWERFRDGEWDFAARDDTGKPYSVALDSFTPRITKVRIKVGAFGDQALSRLLLAQIQREVLRTWDPSLPQAPWTGEAGPDPLMWQASPGNGNSTNGRE